MATHSRILAWRIPWTEEPGGLYGSQGCKQSDTNEVIQHAPWEAVFGTVILVLNNSDKACQYFWLSYRKTEIQQCQLTYLDDILKIYWRYNYELCLVVQILVNYEKKKKQTFKNILLETEVFQAMFPLVE